MLPHLDVGLLEQQPALVPEGGEVVLELRAPEGMGKRGNGDEGRLERAGIWALDSEAVRSSSMQGDVVWGVDRCSVGKYNTEERGGVRWVNTLMLLGYL